MRKIFLIIFSCLLKFVIDNSNVSNLLSNTKAEGKKNLIIGVIKRYSWKTVKQFFISYIKANFKNCECVIFYMRVEQDLLTKLKSLGIITYEIPLQYQRMKINNVRYKLYEEFLSDKLDKYNMVLHADIRDTIFQKDIFELYENKGAFIGVAEEELNLTYKFAENWMKGQYGLEVYEKIKNEISVCSGTIWGTVNHFYKLVRNIWKEIEAKSPYKDSIHDQTAENYLIYYKKIFKDEEIIKSGNNYGPVMTNGLSQARNFSFNSEGFVLNFKGDMAAVIHQYDRISSIVAMVQNKFLNESDNITINELINSIDKKNNTIIDIKTKKNKINYKIIVLVIILIIAFIFVIFCYYNKIGKSHYKSIKKISKKKRTKFKRVKIIFK